MKYRSLVAKNCLGLALVLLAISSAHAGMWENIQGVFSTPLSVKQSIKKSIKQSIFYQEMPTSQLEGLLEKADNLRPEVLRAAIRAYQRAETKGLVGKRVITIIDYSLPSTQPRLWVIDLKNKQIPFHTLVAHGQGSGNNLPNHFSNDPGSKASSLGVFLTGGTYYGSKGLSLNLYGLEKNINDKAYARRVVMHGAPYVNDQVVRSYGRLGRSWGCPAVAGNLAPKIINYIKKGTLIFAYYPDRKWLHNSRFLT